MKSRESEIKGRAWALLLRTHATLVERIEAALSAAGLPPLAWYDVLWELEKADGGKMRMSELAERVVLSRSNLTRLADRLEKANLLRREACADDKRGAYCAITQAGLQMRQKMWPFYREQIDQLFGAHLSLEEARIMVQGFEKILQAAKVGEQED
jgi:DNA-binding MarR family transcriptional regulator